MGGDIKWTELAKYRGQWQAKVLVVLKSWVILTEFYLPILTNKHPRGVKRPGSEADHSPPTSAENQEYV
jgi:hypothetical protein